MTERGHITSVRGLAGRVRLLAVLCALACVLVSPAARAAAPFCDPSGASMPAPVPTLPNATGEMSVPENCDEHGSPFARESAPNREQPPLQRLWELPDRAVAPPFAFPILSGDSLPSPSRAVAVRLPGHSPGVFRPPRA